MQTHGDDKYQAASLLSQATDWDTLTVEHRRVAPGPQRCIKPQCTEFVHILSGKAKVRRMGDGQLQEGMALPGTSWLVPAGTDETLLELDGTTECLIVFLPAKPLADVAANGYGIDPEQSRLAYIGGFADPILTQIGGALQQLGGADAEPIERLMAESLGIALAARLVGSYSVDRARAPARFPALDPRRLKRVLDLIETRLAEPLTLDEMASEACLSPFHFCRLFTKATGDTPHRYLVGRRIATAQAMLRRGEESLAGVALDVGFGSQASFSRSFRQATGLTPGEYRRLHRAAAVGSLLPTQPQHPQHASQERERAPARRPNRRTGANL